MRASPDADPLPTCFCRCRYDYQPSAPQPVLSSLNTPFVSFIHRFHGCFLCVICGWIGAPKLDLVLQLDSLLASHAFANLFRERKRIFGARVLTFSDDEVRVYRRDDCTAASLSLHSHLINDLAGSDRARWRVLEEATSGTRTVRLSRQSTALRIIHTH